MARAWRATEAKPPSVSVVSCTSQGFTESTCVWSRIILDVLEGTPTPHAKDDVRAYAWINLAAAGNFPGAAEERDAMEPKLTPEQKVEAQRLSAEIFEKIVTRQQ